MGEILTTAGSQIALFLSIRAFCGQTTLCKSLNELR